VGHRVKIHQITPASGKERGDVEIRDYVVLQKPRDLTDCLPPPCTLILDFTLTHTRFGRSQMSSLGQLTHTRRTDGAPEPDGTLRTVTRAKIRHYRQLCICTLTVKSRLWLMRYQRNQNNLDFFAQLLYRLICHLGLLHHYRVSFVLDVLHHS
jgi:hypothetical protein